MKLIEQLRGELEKRMKETPKIALKHEHFIDCSFPIKEITIDDHPALEVGNDVIVFPVPEAVHLPADYNGPVRIAVISQTRRSPASVGVNKALGLAHPTRSLTDLKLSVAEAASMAITAASGMRFIEMALQGAFADAKNVAPKLQPTRGLTDGAADAARAIAFYDGGLPPLDLFREFARELGLSYSEASPMRDAHRTTSLEYIPIGDRTAMAIDGDLLLVPGDELPISAFSEHEREGEPVAQRSSRHRKSQSQCESNRDIAETCGLDLGVRRILRFRLLRHLGRRVSYGVRHAYSRTQLDEQPRRKRRVIFGVNRAARRHAYSLFHLLCESSRPSLDFRRCDCRGLCQRRTLSPLARW